MFLRMFNMTFSSDPTNFAIPQLPLAESRDSEVISRPFYFEKNGFTQRNTEKEDKPHQNTICFLHAIAGVPILLQSLLEGIAISLLQCLHFMFYQEALRWLKNLTLWLISYSLHITQHHMKRSLLESQLDSQNCSQ